VPELLQVVTATDSHAEADRLAQDSVVGRLAASAQVDGPIQSVYWWEGKVITAEEWRITMKTAADRYEELEAFIIENHSYETPAILATLVASVSERYLTWVTDETRPPG
jgi:periplasmic divalent cation tolerance protein